VSHDTTPHLALDLLPDEWAAVMAELGQPAYRARQVFHALHAEGAREWDAVRTLPGALRARLAERYALAPSGVARRAQARDGTAKYLLALRDGREVEAVHIPDAGRVTVCVSSQAGCALACTFCATGRMGLLRNLAAGEIVDQVERAREGEPSPNVVFMGMGEPLANYARVVGALRRLVDRPPAGLGLSRRSITLSTVGLVPAIGKLAEENLGVTLAVSLHAPDDELRDTLVPVNTRWKVAEVLAAADAYAARTGRRYSIEYAMIRDINDQPWRADLLGRLLSTRLAHVNLIPLNPTPGSAWDASPKPVEREFVRRLEAQGVSTTVRDTRGRDIDGACGQLAAGTS
jgi:23S rRNA (adenine2503-C2)-methyltransferase